MILSGKLLGPLLCEPTKSILSPACVNSLYNPYGKNHLSSTHTFGAGISDRHDFYCFDAAGASIFINDITVMKINRVDNTFAAKFFDLYILSPPYQNIYFYATSF